jgi:CRP-like cAMP-binding protein
MPPDTDQHSGLKSAIAGFRAGGGAAGRDEAPWLPDWREEDWNLLFGFMDIRSVPSGQALIRRGEPDRTLYFVLRGELEIIVQSSDGHTMGRVARVGAGAVLGELAFFDGGHGEPWAGAQLAFRARPSSCDPTAPDHCQARRMKWRRLGRRPIITPQLIDCSFDRGLSGALRGPNLV